MARIDIGQSFRFYKESWQHEALSYKILAAIWAAEVSPTDLPMRLDDAGASLTNLPDQQRQIMVYI